MVLPRKTTTVPIVFLAVEDPVAIGVAPNFARTGGNITGFMTFNPELAGKWLEILKEVAPRILRVAVVFNPKTTHYYRDVYALPLQSAARSLGIELTEAHIEDQALIDSIIAACAKETICGLFVIPDPFTLTFRLAIIAAAAQHRVPAVYSYSDMVRVGGRARSGRCGQTQGRRRRARGPHRSSRGVSDHLPS